MILEGLMLLALRQILAFLEYINICTLSHFRLWETYYGE